MAISERSRKARLMASIRLRAAAAALKRLQGKIADAVREDREIDRRQEQAEREGWGDDAVLAEEKGRQMGGRAFNRTRGGNPGHGSKRSSGAAGGRRGNGTPRASKPKHPRCPLCKHSAPHDPKAGCLHLHGSKFCSCKG
jgi:hypothetical protein